jgi:GTP-binding protein
MAGEFVATIGDISNIKDILHGPFIKGRRERRVAMIGRSNVGKSSLINALVGTRVAQVSKEPGKTRCVHLYLWKEAKKIIADLPGYGYAKAAHTERERWEAFIHAYLTGDEGLERAVVLLDSRHGPTELDCEAIRFLSSASLPISFVFTKTDSLKNQAERARRKKEADAKLLELGYDPKMAIWVSSDKKEGLKELTRELISEAPPTQNLEKK